MRIYPSVLAGDFACLSPSLEALEEAGFPHLHLDVMDGHFVPNISFGPPVLRSLTETHGEMIYDAHLMIEEPGKYLDPLLELNLDTVSVHVEVDPDLARVRERCHEYQTKLGLAFNPDTPLDSHREQIRRADFVLIMTVQPGFGGQSFREDVLPKIEQARDLTPAPIQVDGGINKDTIVRAASHGASWFVAGSAVLGAESPPDAARALRDRARG